MFGFLNWLSGFLITVEEIEKYGQNLESEKEWQSWVQSVDANDSSKNVEEA